MLSLEDKEVYIFNSLLEVLFKANLHNEKRWDSNICYNTVILFDTLDDFPHLATFEFVNHNKEDWGLSDSRTIRLYNEFL